MGIADVIPGVSGATIAILTGIYQRLLNVIHSICNIKKITKQGPIFYIKNIDFKFVAPLAVGIISAVLLVAHPIKFLLENFESATFGALVGLLLALCVTGYIKHYPSNPKNHIAIIALPVTTLLLFFLRIQLPTQAPWFLVSGFVAGSFMILPGVSGSYILLILGHYQEVIEALTQPLKNILLLGILGLGALTGIVVVALFFRELFNKKKEFATLLSYSMVLGSLPFLLGNVEQLTLGTVIAISVGILVGIILHFIPNLAIRKKH